MNFKQIIKILKFPKDRLILNKSSLPISSKILFSTNSTDKVVKSDDRKTLPSTSISIKVKEGVKDATYSLVFVGGILFTGFGFYYVFQELFSSESPQGIYDKVFKLCSNDEKIINLIGGNMKGYGETDRRGRRRHTAHTEWIDKDKKKHISMKFYIEGTLDKATVFLEMIKDDHNKYQYKYVLVETTSYPQRAMFLIDNR